MTAHAGIKMVAKTIINVPLLVMLMKMLLLQRHGLGRSAR